jgi:ATP-binding cassette, subfamily B, bacterial
VAEASAAPHEGAEAAPVVTRRARGLSSARSLSPLLTLAPYLLRHRVVMALACLALIVSALAMLAIPMAVRRVIDVGFSDKDGVLIDRYFSVLILIGLV